MTPATNAPSPPSIRVLAERIADVSRPPKADVQDVSDAVDALLDRSVGAEEYVIRAAAEHQVARVTRGQGRERQNPGCYPPGSMHAVIGNQVDSAHPSGTEPPAFAVARCPTGS